MQITTKFHGELKINETEIYTFESGIPGFLEEKQFCLLALDETPFRVLQSISTPELAFVIVNPFEFFQDYEVKLSDEVLQELQIQTEEDVALFAILTVKAPFEETTANLQAPIIINTTNHLAKQYITNEKSLQTRQLLIQPATSEEQEVK